MRLPLASKFPLTFAPVPVTTNMLALPFTEVLTLPLVSGIDTLLVPFAIVVVSAVVQVRLPEPSVCKY